MSEPLADKPRHPNQTPPALTKQRQLHFLHLLSTTGQMKASCTAMKMDTSVPYQWAARSASFAKRFEEAKAQGEKVLLDAYEAQVDTRAFTGQSDPQSAVLTMFRMKRLDPRYRDNAPSVQMAGPVQINFYAQLASSDTSRPAITSQEGSPATEAQVNQ
jgi:hypothetical protein